MKHPQTNTPVKKPWSPQKRAVTAAYFSAGILLVALVIGGGLYLIGRRVGLIPRQDIKEAVMEEALEDGELVKAYLSERKQIVCTNSDYRLEVRYDVSLGLTQEERDPACMRFRLTNASGGRSVIELNPWETTKEEALSIMLSRLTNIVTDSFAKGSYDAVLVRGLKENKEYAGVVMMTGERQAWVMEVTPADVLSEQRMLKLAESFRVDID
jgi:hypothetical protein